MLSNRGLSPKRLSNPTNREQTSFLWKSPLSNSKYEERWASNNPFVLHFLLNGFLTNNLNSDIKDTLTCFNYLLEEGIASPWASEIAAELKRGAEYENPIIEIKDAVLTLPVKAIPYSMTKIPSLSHNLIVCGGYVNQISRHVLAFRFIPSQLRIIFTNTGEGNDLAGKKDFYSTCRVWKFPTPELFQENAKRILAAIDHPHMTNIKIAYKYQVDVIDKQYLDKEAIFRNTGTAKTSPVWLTDQNNWEILENKLYTKLQCTTTSTFHAIFWQLLVDVWLREGSLSASHLEETCRNYVLNSTQKTPTSARKAEQISCIQLLVRVYSSFRNRDVALKTLLLLPEVGHTLTSPILDKNLPARVIDAVNSDLTPLFQSLNKIKAGKYVEDIISDLFNLLRHIFIEQDIVRKRLAQDNIKGNLFRFHLDGIASSAIAYVDTLDIKAPSVLDLKAAVMCLAYFHELSAQRDSGFNLKLYPDMPNTVLIGIIGRIHSTLPKKEQLLPHSIPFTNIDEIFKLNAKCSTATFIRDYGNYSSYKLNVVENDPLSKVWEERSSPNKLNSPPSLISNLPRGSIEKFATSRLVNECILAALLLARDFSHRVIFDQDKIIFPEYGTGDATTYIKIKREKPSAALGFISDLEAGLPLNRVVVRGKLFPSTESLSHSCFEIKNEILEAGNVANAIPDNFYTVRMEWFKSVWLNVIPSISTIYTQESKLLLCCGWLFYLWPEGPPNNFIPLPSTTDTLASNMLTLWLTQGQKGSINKLFVQEKNIHVYLTSKKEKLNKTKKVLKSVFYFNNTLFYNSGLAVNLLKEVDPFIRSEKTKTSILNTGSPLPLNLQKLSWSGEHKTVTYSAEDRKLSHIYIQNESWLLNIWIQVRNLQIPCALWQKGTTPILELHLDNIVTITNTQLITPDEEVYTLLLPQEVPFCMRQWCQDYESCLAIPLKRNNRYFFFLASASPVTLNNSVFDRIGITIPTSYTPVWYIYTMQSCGLAPIVNRDTPGWPFLFLHLMNSVKQTCLELLRTSFTYLVRSKTLNKNEIFIKITGSPLPTAKRYINDKNRSSYMQYLNEEYDLPMEREGYAQEKIWSVLRCGVNPIIRKYADLFLTIVHSNLNSTSNPRTQVQQLFEITSGLLMRPEQEDLLEDMWQDLVTKQAKVRIALMGIGKSKVLVPTLTIRNLLIGEEVSIIQPSHLVPQTLATLDEILPFLFTEEKFRVMSDSTAKREYLFLRSGMTKGTHNNKRVVLLDEVDTMYNCFKSEFNSPFVRVFHPLEKEIPLEEYYNVVVKASYSQEYKFSDSFPDRFKKKFRTNLKEAAKLRISFNYGLANEIGELLAVPYSAVSTPVSGAIFSDIDLTAILSCFIRRHFGLVALDFDLLQTRLYFWHTILNIQSVVGIAITDILTLSPKTAVQIYGQNTELQIFYLTYILLPEMLHTFLEQFNVSFLDLMAPAYSIKRIGFSGTELIHLPTFTDYPWVSIIHDSIGEAKIKASIIGWDKQTRIYPYSYDNLWRVLPNYEVLIDADALLKDYSALDIVEKWANLEKNPDYVYIFIDDAHIAREYSYGQKENFTFYKYNENITYRCYFDQRHTIGIDLVLKANALTLTLLGSDSTLTNVAQAIYRLRKIGPSGQRTHYMCSGFLPDGGEELYIVLKQNDEEYKDSMLPRHNIQNEKCVRRQQLNHIPDSYREKIRYYSEDIHPREEQDIHHEEEQEQEQEQEKEQSVRAPQGISCYKEDNLSSASIDDYNTVSWGFYEPDLDLSISKLVLKERDEDKRKKIKNVSFIAFPNGHCKIITLAEELLIKARGLVNDLKGVFGHRYDPIPKQASPSYHLAVGICDRRLPLDSQLIIIKHISNKKALSKVAYCFNTLGYEILVEYLNSELSNIEYLMRFTRSYDVFMKRWVRWPLRNKYSCQYWAKCLAILDSNLKVECNE